MTTLGYICAAFGLLFACGLGAVVAIDVYMIRNGRGSISRRLLYAPKWFVSVVSLAFGVVVGILIGHLWFAQYVP